MRHLRSSSSTQIPLFPVTPEAAPRIELTAAQHRELIRALAELLLQVAANASVATPEGGRDADG